MTRTLFSALAAVMVAAAGAQGLAEDPRRTAVVGRVVFEGAVPESGQLRMGADPKCALIHDAPVLDDEVVVNPNGTLKNVLVYIKEGLRGDGDFKPPSEPAVLDQAGCIYAPRVVGVQVGQELEIWNSDPTLHNVNSRSRANRQFNTGMPAQGMVIRRTFRTPEILEIRCQVHRWMRATVGVFDHPFFAVTGDDGSFTLPDLPPGEYTLEAWHERYGTRTLKVTIAGGETRPVEFRFGDS